MDLGWCDVCLRVGDIGVTREFYEKLGFRPVEGSDDEGWRILSNGDLRLALFTGAVSEPTLNFRGGDVFALAERLTALGIDMESGPEVEPDGTHGALFRDPDGVPIYLNTAPGETKPE